MAKPENKIVTDRKSPSNESEYIKVYKDQYPKANKSDCIDISAVTAKDGTRGRALLN